MHTFHLFSCLPSLKPSVQHEVTMVTSGTIVHSQSLVEMISVFFICQYNIWFFKCYVFSIMFNLFPSTSVYLEFLLGMGIDLLTFSNTLSVHFIWGIWLFYFNLLRLLYALYWHISWQWTMLAFLELTHLATM